MGTKRPDHSQAGHAASFPLLFKADHLLSCFISGLEPTGITVDATEYFDIMGTPGQNEKLLANAILEVAKFVSSMLCAVFLIEYIDASSAS